MAKKKVTFTKEQKDRLIKLITELRKANQKMIETLEERIEQDEGSNEDDNDLLLQEEAIRDTFTLFMNNIKKLPTKKEHMEVCVYVSGGCVQGAIGTHPIAVNVFDADNMEETHTYDEVEAEWEALKKTYPINIL